MGGQSVPILTPAAFLAEAADFPEWPILAGKPAHASAPRRSASAAGFRRDMPLEVHCAVQNPHDLEAGFVHSEKNHMFPFRRNLAAGKKIPAEPEF